MDRPVTGEGRTRAVAVLSVPAAAVRPLRQTVLRPGQPADSCVYPGDNDPRTVHFAAYLDGQLVGIASLYAEGRPEGAPAEPGWRLRGMASAPEVRGVGVGRAVLQACLDHVAGEGGGEVWCNARTPAIGFYAAAGFEIVSEPFDIPGIGPHVVMRRVVR